MDLVATVRASGATCELIGKSEVAISGKAAAFGGRMMNAVTDQVLQQFVANFAALVQKVDAPQAASSADDPTVAAAGTITPVAAASPALARSTELNGLALAWAALREWLRGLFSRKTA
jgi:hypothetical protein